MSNMDFLSLLKEKVTGVTDFVVKKSGQLVDGTKLSYTINAEESDLKKKYEKIGRMVYDAKTGEGELSDEINTICDDITLSLEKIADMKQQLNKVKNKKECPHCGHEIDSDAQFCSSCGCKCDE